MSREQARGDYRKRGTRRAKRGGGGGDVLLGKVGTEIAQGSSGTFTIYKGVKGSETATSKTKDAFCRESAILPTQMAYLKRVGSGWEATAAPTLVAAVADQQGFDPGTYAAVSLADSSFAATATQVMATNDALVTIPINSKLYISHVHPLSGWRIVWAAICEDEA